MTSKRRVEVTFDTALPCGTIGRFTLDKESWIAVPHTKYRRLTTVIDRLIGHNARVRRELIRWINAWPNDADRVAAAFGIINSAEELSNDVIDEKMRAITS
jgi:hypothetical protein